MADTTPVQLNAFDNSIVTTLDVPVPLPDIIVCWGRYFVPATGGVEHYNEATVFTAPES